MLVDKNANQGILMQDIASQRKLAEQLRQQGAQELQGQMVSGIYVAPSWTQQLARVLQSGLGGYYERDAANKEKDFAAERSRKMAEILQGNKPRQIEGEATISTSMPAYEPTQQDRFGSPLPNVERQPIETVTPNVTQETPEQVRERQQAEILNYMSQYGSSPESQYLLGQMDKQDDRAYGEQLEEKLYNRDRTDKLSDVDAERKYQDIVRDDQQGFQVSQQDRQFAQQFQMQKQNQGFQAGQNALNRAQTERLSGDGKPPTGYRFTQSGSLEAIPGGPADIKSGELGEKKKRQLEGAVGQADRLITKVDQALNKVTGTTSGYGYAVTPKSVESLTGAKDLGADLETIKANLGFAELQAMRDASPTGGALGQVAVQELVALQSTVASLDQAQSPEQLRARLGEIKTHYENWKKAVTESNSNGENIMPKNEPMPSNGLPDKSAIEAEIARRRGGK